MTRATIAAGKWVAVCPHGDEDALPLSVYMHKNLPVFLCSECWDGLRTREVAESLRPVRLKAAVPIRLQDVPS